ncbi:unnamed protein product [Rotaria sp. Silwood2]|nr:unnamed protein product [Rotaria sp. Silwood2]CAF4605171.1 unnamed protein product [Rotaria sp. Silwood2]
MSWKIFLFATYTKDNSSKAPIICIIVHKWFSRPSKINISVVAPLMMISNVLSLLYDGETFYVLSSKVYIDSVLNLNEDDWKTLILYGKIGNKLHELRTFVSHMKNESIIIEKEKLTLNFDFKYSKQRDDIVSNIAKLKLNEIDNSMELNQPRSYTINDFTFLSNRAKVLTTTDDEYSDIIDILDHTNVPLIECAISMEQGPFVLWLKQPNNLEDTITDFIINFPLEGNKNLINCIIANSVCGYCAKSYINATINNSKK